MFIKTLWPRSGDPIRASFGPAPGAFTSAIQALLPDRPVPGPVHAQGMLDAVAVPVVPACSDAATLAAPEGRGSVALAGWLMPACALGVAVGLCLIAVRCIGQAGHAFAPYQRFVAATAPVTPARRDAADDARSAGRSGAAGAARP